jgi:NADPH:quinone reductase-like Zn-dependent oxidoreductase
MKAIVQAKYGAPGDVLQLQDIDKPVVKVDEVLVRVHAASVHPDIWHAVTGQPYVLRLMGSGFRRPRNMVPGIDAAGRVAAVGAKVT